MRWLVVVLFAFVAAGCGGAEQSSDDAVRAEMAKVETTCAKAVNCERDSFHAFRKCTHASLGFRACTIFRERGEETGIYRRGQPGWIKVAGPARKSAGGVVCSRRRIAATLVGQWSGECETQTTYAVRDGKARAIFAQSESSAVGWSLDGRARVRVPMAGPDPRGDLRAGVYLIGPRTLVHTLERPVGRGPAC